MLTDQKVQVGVAGGTCIATPLDVANIYQCLLEHSLD